MLSQLSRILLARSVVVTSCIVLLWVLSAASGQSNLATDEVASPDSTVNALPAPTDTGETPPPVEEAAYVGANQCFICHRPQTSTWSASKHAQAFASVPEMYQDDPTCLKCHVTGFGQPGGYVAGSEMTQLLHVGCESCHGPGSMHIDAARRFIMADPGEEEAIIQQIRETIVALPTDSVCIGCHQSQAHKSHPEYEGQPSERLAPHGVVQFDPGYAVAQRSKAIAAKAGGLRYSIKSCGGCHYDQYMEWHSGSHADLTAMLPAKYSGDENCQDCHRPAQTAWSGLNGGADEHHNVIGAACESCHGPGHDHIGFAKQLIAMPRLGPKLEEQARDSIRQGKPANSCLNCHLDMAHKQHPPFDEE